MDKLTATVFLVDDDARVLKSITRLLQSEGWTTNAYRSAAEFLAQHDPAVPGCLVLDLAMPDMSGLGLQSALQDLGQCRPIVFLSGHAAIPACASAMNQAGRSGCAARRRAEGERARHPAAGGSRQAGQS
jgi:FixJ family two-component response regulator